MSSSKKNPVYTIHCNSFLEILILGSFVVSLIGAIKGIESRLVTVASPGFLAVLSIYVFFMVCRDYEFSENGIQVKFVSIPIKKISWGRIQQRIIMRKWWDGRRPRTDPILLITFGGYDRFEEGYEDVTTYIRNHRSSSMMIYVPYHSVDSCIDALKQLGQDVEEYGYHR